MGSTEKRESARVSPPADCPMTHLVRVGFNRGDGGRGYGELGNDNGDRPTESC